VHRLDVSHGVGKARSPPLASCFLLPGGFEHPETFSTYSGEFRKSSHLPYLLLGTDIGGFIVQRVGSLVRCEQVFSEPMALDVGSNEFLVKLLVALD
jgi:hypothetical protein